jgi:hypothetical protein
MYNRSINDLPEKIILHILIKGCENRFTELGVVCSRTLKEFARLSRLVCRKWMAVIDAPSSNNWSFWVSRLSLEVRDSERHHQQSIPFARSLADFRSQLDTSQGCDLEITIIVPATSHRNFPEKILSPASVTLLRLLLHALDDINPIP